MQSPLALLFILALCTYCSVVIALPIKTEDPEVIPIGAASLVVEETAGDDDLDDVDEDDDDEEETAEGWVVVSEGEIDRLFDKIEAAEGGADLPLTKALKEATTEATKTEVSSTTATAKPLEETTTPTEKTVVVSSTEAPTVETTVEVKLTTPSSSPASTSVTSA